MYQEASSEQLECTQINVENCSFEPDPSIDHGRIALLDTLRWSLSGAGDRLLAITRGDADPSLLLTTPQGRRYSGVATGHPKDKPTISLKIPFESVEPETLRNKISSISLPFGIITISETPFMSSRCIGHNKNGRSIATVERFSFEGSQSRLIEIFGDDEVVVDQIADQLRGADGSIEVTLNDTIALLSAMAKRKPGDFSTSFEIGSGKKLNDALYDLLKRSMPSLRIAYEAVRLEIDEESLHDLRVIARSIKSIFSAAARYLPYEEVSAFLEAVSSLINVTTSHRDIDVAIEYLTQFPEFEGACNVLEERRRYLADSFKVELETAIERVSSSWKVAAARLVVTSSREAISVEEFYKKEAERVHGKIVQGIKRGEGGQGLAIEELHTLRKRFKKLRYLTETFHRDSSADPLAITSKTFQTSLGLLQDCQVLLDLLLDVEESAGPWGQSVEAAIVHSQERLETARLESLSKLSQLIGPPPGKTEERPNKKSNSKRAGKSK